MRWQWKAVAQAALSRVPYHQKLYRWLHSTFGQARRSLGDQLDRKLRLFNRMRSNGPSIEDKVILEIGTGWHPVFPLLLFLAGARRVLTLDMNPWLTRTTLGVTLDGIEQQADRVADELGISAADVRQQLAAARSTLADARATPATVLQGCRIEYRMPCDAAATGLPAETIDWVISANVLEHVPKPVIAAIFAEAHRLLHPQGMMYHHVNPGDHFSQDPRISTANFLHFSSPAWYFLGGSGVAYHNRLRCVEYIRLTEEAHFEITQTYVNTDERALAELKTGTLRAHPDFQSYTLEQLACDIIGIFARPLKGAASKTNL
jgi:hypothetical protein